MSVLTLSSLLPDSAAVRRDAAPESRLDWPSVPAKCAVYLLAAGGGGDDGEQPLLLATVGNLRAALQRRLSPQNPADVPPSPSKRIPYDQICSRVYWRTVHSSFAANWWYWNAARALFPQTYGQMTAFRPAWWISLDREATYPQFRRTQNLDDGSLRYLGPIRDKTSAGKLIDTLEDLFDLCRYHNILLQTPHGKACAYKEMGKCPAPCDGSSSMEVYYRQLDQALNFLSADTREQWLLQNQAAMKTAAGKLEFERAAKIKQRLSRGELIHADAYSHLQPLERFSFVALQPGQGKPFVEPWLIHGGTVECLPQIRKKELPAALDAIFAKCQALANQPVSPPLDAAAIEQIAIVAHHLFRGLDDDGIYLRLSEITTVAPIAAAIDQIMHHKPPVKRLMEQASDNTPQPATLLASPEISSEG